MGKTIGIDLGTTNSVVAVYEAGEPNVVTNTNGQRTTPSVVGFAGDGERLVGQMAKRQAVQNPRQTISSIKRFMGRRHHEVKEEETKVPYEVVGNSDDLVKVKVGESEYTPPEISAMILKDLKKSAEDYLGEEVTEAVITVPAYFNDSQRQATKDAGAIAGLDVKRIINEPTAAGFAYGMSKKKEGTVAVFDLGGGTFDITLLDISDVDGEQFFEVKATNGDTHLGGDDFDEAIINWLADQFKNDYGIDLRDDHMALQRLKEGAEKAKVELSSVPSTTINLPFITQDPSTKNPVHMNYNLSRSKFEQLCENIINRVVDPCKQVLADAKLESDKISEVILVGGSTRIPKVQSVVEKIFGKKPNKSVNPDEAVALGAAIQADVLSEDSTSSVTLLDVTPLSLGLEIEGGIMHKLVERNTTIPTQKKEVFSTAANNQPAVDIQVYQGEREMAKDNRMLGHFKLDGIRPAPRGVPQIEVAFDIDANGILNVSAKDLDTNKEQKIKIESSSGLSDNDIERMKKEAEQYAEEDKNRREEAEARNQADQLEYQTRQQLNDLGDKLDESVKSRVVDQLDKLRTALDNNEIENIKNEKSNLEELLRDSEVSNAFYNAMNQNQETPDTQTQQETPDDEEVVDAEYTVSDENK